MADSVPEIQLSYDTAHKACSELKRWKKEDIQRFVSVINQQIRLGVNVNTRNDEGKTCLSVLFKTINRLRDDYIAKKRLDGITVYESCFLCSVECNGDTAMTDCILTLCRLLEPELETINETLFFVGLRQPSTMTCEIKCGQKILLEVLNHPKVTNCYQKTNLELYGKLTSCIQLCLKMVLDKHNVPFINWMITECTLEWDLDSPIYQTDDRCRTLLMVIIESKIGKNGRCARNYKEYVSVVQNLVSESRTDITVQDEMGWTVAYYAVMTYQPIIARMILTHDKCDVNMPNHYGNTIYNAFIESKERIETDCYNHDNYINIKSLLEKLMRDSINKKKVNAVSDTLDVPGKKDIIESFDVIKQIILRADCDDKEFLIKHVEFLISELNLPQKSRGLPETTLGALTDEHRNSLLANYCFLCEEIDPRELYPLYIQENVFSTDHIDYINSYGKTRRERCQIFVGILLRSSDAGFTTLCAALTRNGQEYVAKALQTVTEDKELTQTRVDLVPAIGFPPIWVHPSFSAASPIDKVPMLTMSSPGVPREMPDTYEVD